MNRAVGPEVRSEGFVRHGVILACDEEHCHMGRLWSGMWVCGRFFCPAFAELVESFMYD